MNRISQFMVLVVASLSTSAGAQTVKYIHTDALGSIVAVSDVAGNVIERREYEPYGAQLTPALRDGPGFTGHVQDATTGLTYMQQRYYDPLVGRFLSVDPVTAYSDPIGAFNRYKYAANNPYRFTDPDGRYEEDVHRDLTAVLALAAGAPQGIAYQIAAGNQGVDDNPSTSPMGMSPFGKAVQVRADYHFTSSERREQMYQEFKKSGNPLDMGKYLHAHQDSYSHDGYGARFGHLSDGHAPDKTYNDVAKANRMARATYNTILNSREAFRADGQAVSFGEAVPWGRIAPIVDRFNSARTAAEKEKELDKIRSFVR